MDIAERGFRRCNYIEGDSAMPDHCRSGLLYFCTRTCVIARRATHFPLFHEYRKWATMQVQTWPSTKAMHKKRLSHFIQRQRCVHAIRRLAVVANWKAEVCCSASGHAFAAVSLRFCQAVPSKFEQCSDVGSESKIISLPRLGGLHHRYMVAA